MLRAQHNTSTVDPDGGVWTTPPSSSSATAARKHKRGKRKGRTEIGGSSRTGGYVGGIKGKCLPTSERLGVGSDGGGRSVVAAANVRSDVKENAGQQTEENLDKAQVPLGFICFLCETSVLLAK